MPVVAVLKETSAPDQRPVLVANQAAAAGHGQWYNIA